MVPLVVQPGTESGLEPLLVDLLIVLVIAGTLGAFAARVTRVPYTVVLLVVGLGVSILGIDLQIGLSRDLVLLVLLPALVFQGGVNIDYRAFRENALTILALAIPALLVSVALLGVASTYAFGFPLVVALLFASMILPTDPVSVIAIFEDLGVPERLSVVVEGESLVNDGVGVVLFTAFLGVVLEAEAAGIDPGAFVTPGELLGDIGIGIPIAMGGGVLVGVGAGYAVSGVAKTIDDDLTTVLLTVVLAYGSYLIAEAASASGVVAALTAGLFVGELGREGDVPPSSWLTLTTVWTAVAFVINTYLFVAIGIETPLDTLIADAGPIAVAVVLVFLARAVVVYPTVALADRWTGFSTPWSYQHVLVWSGIHASIPIALVLGLPASFPTGLAANLRSLVFGVAAVTILVQGLTMSGVVERLGLSEQSPIERLYGLLSARLYALDRAQGGLAAMHDREVVPTLVYEELTESYTDERRQLESAIDDLLDRNPGLHRQAEQLAEHQSLLYEREALEDAVSAGIVSQSDAKLLLTETDRRLDRVRTGASRGVPTAHTPAFWKRRLEELEETPDETSEDRPDDTIDRNHEH